MPKTNDFDPYRLLDSQKKANKTYQKESNFKAVKKYAATAKGKKAQRNSKLKTKYGISLEEYNDKLIKQNHKCAICGVDEIEQNRNLCVDHNHKTGKVRDLLCSPCNTGLGMFKENIDTLIQAISYLNKHREDK